MFEIKNKYIVDFWFNTKIIDSGKIDCGKLFDCCKIVSSGKITSDDKTIEENQQDIPVFISENEREHLFETLKKTFDNDHRNDINIENNDYNLEDIKYSHLIQINHKIKLSDIKPVDVLDVLQRNTVKPDTSLLAKNIKNKVVMVTGAGGSIGSELCRQILKQQPKALVLFELSEYALYAIHSELQKLAKNIQQERQLPTVTPLYVHLGSVTNQKLIELLCNQYNVQTIYHAAAYKHVPIVESNEYEGVINNFVGTYNTLKGAVSAGVETFVAISTDKAVRPTNVMGATKRMAELACQAMAANQSTTTISMVRFGNVLGFVYCHQRVAIETLLIMQDLRQIHTKMC